MLWMILTLMVALAAVGLAAPLIRRHDAARAARGSVVEVLKGQLGEIEAQARNGGADAARPLLEALDDDVAAAIQALRTLAGEEHVAV